MTTYILTWNPKLWSWRQDWYSEEVAKTQKGIGKVFPTGWTCGSTKCIVPGDRIFLLRQKTEEADYSIRLRNLERYKGMDFTFRKAQEALYIEYESDVLLPVVERLCIETLIAKIGGFPWNNIMGSGISVPEEYAIRLEKLWQKHLGHLRQSRTRLQRKYKIENLLRARHNVS